MNDLLVRNLPKKELVSKYLAMNDCLNEFNDDEINYRDSLDYYPEDDQKAMKRA